MFGESETGESPRVPSPWDALTSDYPSPAPIPLPKLVEECDFGNVEYKLHLLNPSPARFARLVTQLKWRLLEGGGQAYYELGVADSGALIGLPREDLERTLETLECMAGEIGASVIVVKEIEVPACMAGLSALGGRRRSHKLDPSQGELSTATETETEMTSTTDDDTSPSPVIHPLPPSINSESTNSTPPSHTGNSESLTPQTQFAIDLEISSVYKPRPTNTYTRRFASAPARTKPKPFHSKKQKHERPHQPNTAVENPQTQPHSSRPQFQTKQEEKALIRRITRDRRRDEKQRALAGISIPDVELGADPERKVGGASVKHEFDRDRSQLPLD